MLTSAVLIWMNNIPVYICNIIAFGHVQTTVSIDKTNQGHGVKTCQWGRVKQYQSTVRDLSNSPSKHIFIEPSLASLSWRSPPVFWFKFWILQVFIHLTMFVGWLPMRIIYAGVWSRNLVAQPTCLSCPLTSQLFWLDKPTFLCSKPTCETGNSQLFGGSSPVFRRQTIQCLVWTRDPYICSLLLSYTYQ